MLLISCFTSTQCVKSVLEIQHDYILRAAVKTNVTV